LIGYIVLVQSVHPTYYFASLKSKKALEVQGKIYCGSGRDYGWAHYVLKNAPEDLRAIAKQAKDEHSRNLTYASIDSLQSARSVVSWLNRDEGDLTYEVVKIIVNRWDEKLSTVVSDSSFLGIDIDANGIYPIKEELFAAQIASIGEPEFEEYFQLLNKHGLFESYENASRFVNSYLHIQNEKELEILQKDEICYCYLFRTNT